jgi:hypothetical protein
VPACLGNPVPGCKDVISSDGPEHYSGLKVGGTAGIEGDRFREGKELGGGALAVSRAPAVRRDLGDVNFP